MSPTARSVALAVCLLANLSNVRLSYLDNGDRLIRFGSDSLWPRCHDGRDSR